MSIDQYETAVRNALVRNHKWLVSKANHYVFKLKSDDVFMAFTKGRNPSDVAKAIEEGK